MLARQDVTIKQTDWILRANAGELCIETTPDLDQIKRVVTMNHVQPDGSKIHIKGIVTPDVTDVGYLVTSVRDQDTMGGWIRKVMDIILAIPPDQLQGRIPRAALRAAAWMALPPFWLPTVAPTKCKTSVLLYRDFAGWKKIKGVSSVRAGGLRHASPGFQPGETKAKDRLSERFWGWAP